MSIYFCIYYFIFWLATTTTTTGFEFNVHSDLTSVCAVHTKARQAVSCLKKTLTRKTWKKPHSLTLPPPGGPQNNSHIPPSPAGHWLAVRRVRTTSHHPSPFVHQFLSFCLFVHLLVVSSFPRRVLMFSQSGISAVIHSFVRSFLPSS